MLEQIEPGNFDREGLKDTPVRVAKAFKHWFSGYNQKPEDVLKVFEEAGHHYDEMIFQANLPVNSFCEHHMAPFFGVAHIAYIPGEKGIVGLSKLKRLVDIFAHRLQVQERMTNQIVDALFKHLDAKGAGVLVRCRHRCMESRGVCIAGTWTTTTAFRGAMFQDAKARSEFLALAAEANK